MTGLGLDKIPLDKVLAEGREATLAGAVALDSPLLQMIGKFRSVMAQHKGRAGFCIGLTEEGQIILSNLNPGGQVEALGMLQKAIMMVGGEMGSRPQVQEEKDSDDN